MLTRKEMSDEIARDLAMSRMDDVNYSQMDNLDRTREFHIAMGMMVRDEPGVPSVSERILRARLLLEETFETIQKGLGLDLMFETEHGVEYFIEHDSLNVAPTPFADRGYDPIETLDGLADVKVIANGTAVQFGLPLWAADYEVWCSNMSKLDEEGNPIVNGCITEGHEHEGRSYDLHHDCRLLDPSKPLGKVLKPDTYVPANIVKVFVRFAGDEDENLNRAWLLAHGESK